MGHSTSITRKYSSGQYCRFWAIGTGSVHKYLCGNDSGGTYIYFRVREVNAQYGYYYDIEDCGTSGGYSSCTIKNSTQTAFVNPKGYVLGEASYGYTLCTSRIMGSLSAPDNAGTSANPIQWRTAIGELVEYEVLDRDVCSMLRLQEGIHKFDCVYVG